MKNYSERRLVVIARLDVRTIRKLMEQGMSVPDIAKKYGVTRQAVYQRIKQDDERKKGRASNNYGLDVVKGVGSGNHDYHLIDPETGLAVNAKGNAGAIIARMGDEKVSQFVSYHLEMLKMREGVDRNDVDDLYRRFIGYLMYCAEHGIIPNNMNCYFALNIPRSYISAWKSGKQGTPRHQEFALPQIPIIFYFTRIAFLRRSQKGCTWLTDRYSLVVWAPFE